jgi:hypothetical protein
MGTHVAALRSLDVGLDQDGFNHSNQCPPLISGVVGESDLWEGVMVAERKRRGGGDVRR